MRSVVVAVTVLASTAAAGPRERAAVTSLDVSATAPAYLVPRLTAQIEQGLSAAGYDVMPSTAVRAALGTSFAACRDAGCLRAAGRALSVDVLVVASVASRGESTVIKMRLHDAASGEQLAELGDVCDLCGEAELIERVGIEASALRARVQAARPSGSPERAPSREREEGSVIPGIAIGVAGAAVVAGGIVLVGLDGHGTCHAGDTPVFPDPDAVIRYPDPANHDNFVCRDLYATKALGITSIGVGVAAIALGAVLVVRSHEREVSITPTPGGATVGMAFTW